MHTPRQHHAGSSSRLAAGRPTVLPEQLPQFTAESTPSSPSRRSARPSRAERAGSRQSSTTRPTARACQSAGLQGSEATPGTRPVKNSRPGASEWLASHEQAGSSTQHSAKARDLAKLLWPSCISLELHTVFQPQLPMPAPHIS